MSTLDIIFWIFFLTGVLSGWDSRIAFTGALICLIFLPFLLILKKELSAEMVAVYAYYFLLIGVTEEMIGYWSGNWLKRARVIFGVEK